MTKTNGQKAPATRTPTAADLETVLTCMYGGNSVRATCEELGLAYTTTWQALHSGQMATRYAVAQRGRVEHFMDLALRVALGAATGTPVLVPGSAKPVRIDAHGARVLLDGVKWVVGRMDPSGEPPTRLSHSFEDMDPDARRRRIAELTAIVSSDDDGAALPPSVN